MRKTGIISPALLLIVAAVAACDRDPTQPREELSLQACPASPLGINAPVRLSFTVPLNEATVRGGNVVVSDAATGLEIPGAVAMDPDGDSRSVVFTPSRTFDFDQRLRVRIQNVRSAATNTTIDIVVCEFTTEPPAISEIVWERLPDATSSILRGLSITGPDLVHVVTAEGVVMRRQGDQNFSVLFQREFFTAGTDVRFVTPQRGVMSFRSTREQRSFALRTTDGGITVDTLAVLTGGDIIQRLFFRPVGTGTQMFGVIAGGSAGRAVFMKYNTATGAVAAPQVLGGTSEVRDIAFQSDTARGAAVSNGFVIGSTSFAGKVFRTLDGGTSWAEIAGRQASDTTVFYAGVAIRNNGEIFVAGGNGYLARLTPSGSTYTVTRLLVGTLENLFPANPAGLFFSDVTFAPDNDTIGWAIGKQQVGVFAGIPRYQGFIFATRDGGATWTRQGVIDADNFGASFPGLNRVQAHSSTAVAIAGDEGIVLQLQP